MTIHIPRGACDCHAHVFGPLARFAFIPDRSYTPAERLSSDYRAMLDRFGIDRGVIVQPSVYGTDNGATLNAIAELGGSFRGIAVLPPDVGDKQLAEFNAQGIRGVRLSDIIKGGVPLEHLETMATRLRGGDWHIQVLAEVARDPSLAKRLGTLGVPVVIDLLGLPDPARGVGDPGFQALLSLLRDSDCWLKLSGPYLSSRHAVPYADMTPFAATLVAEVPERLVWATDWPHPAAGDAAPDAAALVALLESWAPDATIRNLILVDNPAKLYGFPSP